MIWFKIMTVPFPLFKSMEHSNVNKTVVDAYIKGS